VNLFVAQNKAILIESNVVQ